MVSFSGLIFKMTHVSRRRRIEVMENHSSIHSLYEWFCQKDIAERLDEKFDQSPDSLCEAREVFNARLSSASVIMGKAGLTADQVGLLTSVAGEIGNNSYDHNLGKWVDAVGACFAWGQFESRFWVCVTDRGQGLFATLKTVCPELENSQQAIDIAFHRRITSRKNELRGNGLKFVRQVINAASGRGLYFQTNGAFHTFGDLGVEAHSELPKILKDTQGPFGTFALLLWEIPINRTSTRALP